MFQNSAFSCRMIGLVCIVAFPVSLSAGAAGLCAERPYAVGRVCDVQDFEDNANLKKAFEFLRTADLKALKDGKVEIDGDNVFAYASTVDLVPIDRDGEFEAHRQYIDIHIPLTEAETIGTHVLTGKELNLPFDEKDDCVLYGAKGGSVTVKPGEFAVFFPPCGGHRPGCTSRKEPLKGHRKLCVKVKADPVLKDLKNVYENPIPNLRSRQAIFPNLCELPDGRLLCCFVLAEAFEAADMRSYLSESMDGGKTWSKPWRMFRDGAVPESETCKVTALGGNRVMALGYAAERPNREGQLANAATGGLLSHRVFCAFSEDGGRTWSGKRTIPDAWNAHTEASAPVVRLKDGALAAPITGFPDWEGQMTSRRCGRMLLSRDEGRTWSDDTVCMAFDGDAVTCYEQRFCVLDSGTIVNVGWNEDMSGKRLPNHITYSTDNGKTFSNPISTGIMGQAASVCALGGETFLVVVAQRRDTDEPGIYAYVCDFSERKWNVIRGGLLWSAGKGPLKRDKNAAETFAFLKFGQPSVTKLRNGRLLLCFWFQKEGQYQVVVGNVTESVLETVPAAGSSGLSLKLAEASVVAADDFFKKDDGRYISWGHGAAVDLTNVLTKIVGRSIPLYRESEAPVGLKGAIYLGDVGAARAADVRDASLRNLAFRIKAVPNRVYIWSRTGSGTAYGVTEFLARFCGYRFLTISGEDPYRCDAGLSVPVCDFTDAPGIYSRIVYPSRASKEERPKSAAAMTASDGGYLRRLRISYAGDDIESSERLSGQTYSCHSSYDYLPPEKYWKDHPEYYSMTAEGKRHCIPARVNANGQLCMSNPEVRRLCTESLLGFIAKDRAKSPGNAPCIYDFTQQDGSDWLCFCPDCRKIIAKYNCVPGGHKEGGDAGLQLEFINEIARTVARRYPEVMIRTFAYCSTEGVPRGIRPEKNVIIWFCDSFSTCNHTLPLVHPVNRERCTLLETWCKLSPRFELWDYNLYGVTYSAGRIFPELSVDAISADARKFRDLGIDRLFMESEFENQPFFELNTYAMGRCYWDPDCDPEKVIDEYCTVYGRGAAKMREAIGLLRRAIAEQPSTDWWNRIMPWRNESFYESFRRPVAEAYRLEPDRIRRARIAKVLAYTDDELAHFRGGDADVARRRIEADRKNWMTYLLEDAIVEFDDPAMRQCVADAFRRDVAARRALDELKFADLPVGVDGAAGRDLFCFDSRRLALHPSEASLVEDVASTVGKAAEFSETTSASVLANKFACGVYDFKTKASASFAVMVSDLPEDGRYRWRKAGYAHLDRDAKFWFPQSWRCDVDLKNCHVTCDGRATDENRFEVWVSLARKNGRIRFDRLVLRRAPMLLK